MFHGELLIVTRGQGAAVALLVWVHQKWGLEAAAAAGLFGMV